MKATELRIGNLVYNIFQAGTPKVESIYSISKTQISTSETTFRFISDNHFKPIPLTEEWLVAFGFEIKGDWTELKGKYRIGIRFYGGNHAECDMIQDDKFIGFGNSHIKYVHQLQNLVHALTGDELTLT